MTRTRVQTVGTTATIDELRTAAEDLAVSISLKRAAVEIGMSPGGLSRFLQGTPPRAYTLRRLRSWHRSAHDRVIGARLKELRERADLSQAKVGEELGLQSPQSGMAKREAGTVRLSRAERKVLASLFGMTESEAFPMCAGEQGQ